MGRLHADVAYDPAATTVTSTVVEVLTRRAGVCQDFTHLALACLRSHGLAARYVSGYLATEPPPGRERYVTLARGRDYGDVAPVRGVVVTEAGTSVLEVAVDVAPLPPPPAPPPG